MDLDIARNLVGNGWVVHDVSRPSEGGIVPYVQQLRRDLGGVLRPFPVAAVSDVQSTGRVAEDDGDEIDVLEHDWVELLDSFRRAPAAE